VAAPRGDEASGGMTDGTVRLSLGQSLEYSRALAAAVARSRFQPDLVLGICEGGVLPAHVVAAELGARCAFLSVRRPASTVKHSLAGRFAAWAISGLYARSLRVRRVTELANRSHRRTVQVSVDAVPRVGERRILVVDDFSETGTTFRVALQTLRSADHDLDIRSAVLTQLAGRQASVFEPEYCISHDWLSFPWSTNSEEYGAYEEWKRRQSIDTRG